MTLAERLLLKLSCEPGQSRTDLNLEDWTPENALRTWREVIPTFDDEIKGRSLVDFACGLGYQAVALIENGANRVLGIDSNGRVLDAARETVHSRALDKKIALKTALDPSDKGSFDIVLSQNGMEHFEEPERALDTMLAALKPGGKMLLTFGPPWLSPYGAHMQFFTNVPWVNLLFSERTVMNVRSHFRDDGAQTYEPALNRMTLDKFEHLIEKTRLTIEYQKYDCVKRLNPLRSLPWIRELFVNRVTVVGRR
jgi:SAM-dependent methyltransferase